MRERTIEKFLKDQVKKHGGISFKWVSPGCRGVPDRIVFFQGAVFFVELKAPGGRLSAQQKVCHKKLEAMGYDVVVLKTKEQVQLWAGLQASILLKAGL